MKLHILSLLIGSLCFCTISQAQIEGNAHELGLSMNGALNFSLLYKKGTPKHLFRLRFLLFNGSNYIDTTGEDSNERYEAGFRLGYEGRKKIHKNFNFVYGIEGGLSYLGTIQNQDVAGTNYYNKKHRLSPAVNAIIGFNLVVKDCIILGLETTPYFAYHHDIYERKNTNFSHKNTSHAISYGFDLGSIRFSAAYRFLGKKKETAG